MAETMTPETTAPAVSVAMSSETVTAILDNARRMQETADAIRENLSPAYVMAQKAAGNAYRMAEASERVTRTLSESVRALQGLRRSGHPSVATLYGRPEDLTRLDREARTVAHGNALLGVRIARYLGGLLVRGRTYTADLAALALRGDADARREWEDMAEDGNADALAVLDLLADLDALTAAADALAGEVAALVSEVSLSQIPETTEPIPPPRLVLSGSLDVHAPPVAPCSATAGNVRPAGRSPMR